MWEVWGGFAKKMKLQSLTREKGLDIVYVKETKLEVVKEFVSSML